MTSGLLFGVEADFSFPNYFISNAVVSSIATPRSYAVELWDYVATVRGRAVATLLSPESVRPG